MLGYLLEAVPFLVRDRKGAVLEGRGEEEKGGVDGGETALRIYCMRKQAIFNIRKKIKKKE